MLLVQPCHWCSLVTGADLSLADPCHWRNRVTNLAFVYAAFIHLGFLDAAVINGVVICRVFIFGLSFLVDFQLIFRFRFQGFGRLASRCDGRDR